MSTIFLVLTYWGSAKTDPVRFKWGFGEGLLKDKFAFFEACKGPIPKRRKLLVKTPIFISKKWPYLKAPLNWTGSVFPLLIFEHSQNSPASPVPGTKLVFPGFREEGTSFRGRVHELFDPRPFVWKSPIPPGGLRTQKLIFVLFILASLFGSCVTFFPFLFYLNLSLSVSLGPPRFRKTERSQSDKAIGTFLQDCTLTMSCVNPQYLNCETKTSLFGRL